MHRIIVITNVAFAAAAAAAAAVVASEYLQILSSDSRYDTLSELFTAFNEHAKSQEYAMIKIRIKKFKKSVLRKCVFRCDRKETFKNSENIDKRIHVSFRLIDCSYSAIVLLKNDF